MPRWAVTTSTSRVRPRRRTRQSAREAARAAIGAGAGVHLQGAVGMMKGALMGAVAGRAAEPPRPEIVSSAGDGVAAAGEVGGDDLRAKLAANAGEDVAMQ